MEHRGLEPLASTMPLWRAPSCANAPKVCKVSPKKAALSRFFSFAGLILQQLHKRVYDPGGHAPDGDAVVLEVGYLVDVAVDDGVVCSFGESVCESVRGRRGCEWADILGALTVAPTDV